MSRCHLPSSDDVKGALGDYLGLFWTMYATVRSGFSGGLTTPSSWLITTPLAYANPDAASEALAHRTSRRPETSYSAEPKPLIVASSASLNSRGCSPLATLALWT